MPLASASDLEAVVPGLDSFIGSPEPLDLIAGVRIHMIAIYPEAPQLFRGIASAGARGWCRVRHLRPVQR